MGLVLAVVAVVILVAGAAVAGTILGPSLLSREKKGEGHEKPDAAHAEKETEGSGKVGEVFELNPRLVDPKAPEREIDRVGCAGQYITGTLWGKSRLATFRELAALSVEVERVREYRALLADSAQSPGAEPAQKG